MIEHNKQNEYDEEPVYYCANCYSLKVQYEDSIDADCCMDCGCSNIEQTSIQNWEAMYQQRYGKKFVLRGDKAKENKVFTMSLDELKMLLYNHPDLYDIIHDLYPYFMGGLGKADSVILFFDKITKDGRLKEFKQLLVNKYKVK